MISKHKLRLKISDLEKQLKWKDAEMDIMRNDIRINLSKIRNLDAAKKRRENDYIRERDKVKEAEDRIECLRNCITILHSENLNNNKKIKSLEEENEKLRKAACVGEILNILNSNFDLMKENIQLKDKIDRISAILKED